MKAFRTAVFQPLPSEEEIQVAVMNQLQLDKWLVVRVNGGGFKDKTGRFVMCYLIKGLNAFAGFPDLLALRGDVPGGRFLLLEIKDHKGKLSKAQERFAKFAKTFGITVHIVRDAKELPTVYQKESP